MNFIIKMIAMIIISLVNKPLLSQPELFLPVITTSGWKTVAEPVQYHGDELFFMIDGGADLFLEYGFIEVATTDYQRNDKILRVEIYQMCSEEMAWGVFSARRPFPSEPGSTNDLAYGKSYLMAVYGPYYFVISCQGSDLHSSELSELYDNLKSTSTVKPIDNFKPNNDSLLAYNQNHQGSLFIGRAGFSSVYSLGYQNLQNFAKGYARKNIDGQIMIRLDYLEIANVDTDFDSFKIMAKSTNRYVIITDQPDCLTLCDRGKNDLTISRKDSSIYINISDHQAN